MSWAWGLDHCLDAARRFLVDLAKYEPAVSAHHPPIRPDDDQ